METGGKWNPSTVLWFLQSYRLNLMNGAFVINILLLLTIVSVGVGSRSLALDTSLPTRILMEDGSPYYFPIAPTVVSHTPIRWDNPTSTHHTVTHSGCLESED